jgi:hypothetical protein
LQTGGIILPTIQAWQGQAGDASQARYFFFFIVWGTDVHEISMFSDFMEDLSDAVRTPDGRVGVRPRAVGQAVPLSNSPLLPWDCQAG